MIDRDRTNDNITEAKLGTNIMGFYGGKLVVVAGSLFGFVVLLLPET
jgi:hypothetical protein